MPVINVSEQLTKIPAQPLAARLILRLVEDPEVSTAQLARLVDTDPVLSARVIRLANSPQYRFQDGVHSAARAVILLGVSAVRGLAAATATKLLADDVSLGPTDSWTHSVSVAAAASAAGELLGVADNESFSVGLLHDIGTTLFHSADPSAYEAMIVSAKPGAFEAAERSTFGMSHAEAGAEALEQWQFPASLVRAVRDHHGPVAEVSPLAQAIILGEAIAEKIDPLALPECTLSLARVVDELGINSTQQARLIARAKTSMAAISSYLGADE